MRKVLLVVAMPESIHSVRWINQICGMEWDIHLFPSLRGESFHPEFDGVIAHYWLHTKVLRKGVTRTKFACLVERILSYIRCAFLDRFFPDYRARLLAKLIRKLQPDLIHTLEFQSAGYLALNSRKMMGDKFPKWLATNWGSDIYLFGQLKSHQNKIKELLSSCDFYSCECERDLVLARQNGFQKTAMPVFPNTGGFNLEELKLIQRETTSSRRNILVKGYQHWAGRSLVALRALERCADMLSDYVICIYSASPDVVIAAELFSGRTGIATHIIPSETSHRTMLEMHGKARISIGLSISDAISTSLLEAMVMGSFPIQSCTACAEEWIEHGVSGLIVPPEDPDIIELAIRTALCDDELVDNAAAINWKVAQHRLDGELLKKKAIDMYQSILK